MAKAANLSTPFQRGKIKGMTGPPTSSGPKSGGKVQKAMPKLRGK